MLFASLLSRIIKTGTITILGPDNQSRTVGSGAPHVTIRVKDRIADMQLALYPQLKLGEAYMDGRGCLQIPAWHWARPIWTGG